MQGCVYVYVRACEGASVCVHEGMKGGEGVKGCVRVCMKGCARVRMKGCVDEGMRASVYEGMCACVYGGVR
eukprot:9785533-Lingulodinium_polyedra.AAC.1